MQMQPAHGSATEESSSLFAPHPVTLTAPADVEEAPINFTAADEEACFIRAVGLVKEVGRIVRDTFDRQPSTDQVAAELKGANSADLVTETDRLVESILIGGLQAVFPSHQFIGEESAAGGKKILFTDAPTWIIDPIDGTTNFVHRLSMTCISVALTVGKKLRLGIVYNPITTELYTARAGAGAYKNGFPIHASKTESINRALIALQIGANRDEDNLRSYLGNSEVLLSGKNKCQGLRSLGSGAICMLRVAEGSLDAFVEYGIHCWDIAAAGLILREAGGALYDPTGAAFNLMGRKILCAGTETLAKSISAILTHVDYDVEA